MYPYIYLLVCYSLYPDNFSTFVLNFRNKGYTRFWCLIPRRKALFNTHHLISDSTKSSDRNNIEFEKDYLKVARSALNARQAVLDSWFSRNQLQGCSKLFGGKMLAMIFFRLTCGNWYKTVLLFSGPSGLHNVLLLSGQREYLFACLPFPRLSVPKRKSSLPTRRPRTHASNVAKDCFLNRNTLDKLTDALCTPSASTTIHPHAGRFVRVHSCHVSSICICSDTTYGFLCTQRVLC